MDLEQRLREALTPCAPGPEVRATVRARLTAKARTATSLRRVPGRIFFLCGVLVVAAAAATLVVQRRNSPPSSSATALSQDPTTQLAPVVEPRDGASEATDTQGAEAEKLRDEAVPERVSMPSPPQPERVSANDGPSVYAPDSELKAGALPARLLGFLDRGLFPASAETLRRREISISQERDGASLSLEEAIKNLIKSTLAVQPESAGMKYMVSCGISLCEVQLEELAPGARGAAQTALNIKILSTFSTDLVRGPSVYEMKDAHPYVVSYWMRVVPVTSVSTTIAASQGAHVASVSVDGTSARNMNDTERDLLEHGSPLQLMTDAHVQYKALDETFVLELQKRHRLVVESPDEPAWARETERKLRETIILSPEGWAFEVDSIVCRRAGCEIQVFENSNRAMRAWSDVQEVLRQAIPFPVMLADIRTTLNGRALLVAYFLRGDGAAPNPAGTP
jgi:hypothetical protein